MYAGFRRATAPITCPGVGAGITTGVAPQQQAALPAAGILEISPMPKFFSMNLNPILGAGALYVLLLFMACSDPTLVGAGLLDEDRAEVGFTDTFTLRGATELSEPLQTFSPFVVQRADRFLFGDFQDPVFGNAKSTLNFQFLPDPNNAPVFEDITGVDSVVLILP